MTRRREDAEEDPFLLFERHRIPEEVRVQIGAFLYAAGVRPKVSTGIDDSTTYGYGRLDGNGFWEYPA